MIYLKEETPQGVRAKWGFVENGLDQIIDKTESDFIPMDIYVGIVNKTMFLHWIYDEYKLIGFTILSVVRTSYKADEKSLSLDHTWVAKDASVLGELDKALDALARSLACSTIEFNSPRKGFLRAMQKLNWKPLCITYKRNVNG